MNRRDFLKFLTLGLTGIAGCKLLPEDGIFNPCLPANAMPDYLARHEMVHSAWEGIDPKKMWDCHVHLVGVGDGKTGAWVTDKMTSIFHPIQSIQMKFFKNGSCAETKGRIDQEFVSRLVDLHLGFKQGTKFMLVAFDYVYTEQGKRNEKISSFYIPNRYAAKIAKRYPLLFEWIASIHPYRKDCTEALDLAIKNKAKAIKWLPQAMGINPASPLCDRFYNALSRRGIPLLSHGGAERAVHGAAEKTFGNPLLLRRALDHNVRVIVAHCASMGKSIDLDKGKNGPYVDNFTLFSRLMDDPKYKHLITGDISAVTQINRVDVAIQKIIERQSWHPRLLNGSDYPLPGIYPLFSLSLLIKRRFIKKTEAQILSQIRLYNPLLFDFVLKRHLQIGKKRLSLDLFHTRPFFN